MKTYRYLLVILIPLIALTGCMKDWEAPTWNTRLELTLMDKTYSAGELLSDTLFTTQNGNMAMIYSADIDPVTITHSINLNSKQATFPIINNTAMSDLVLDISETGQFQNEHGHGPEDIQVMHAIIDECLFWFRVGDTSLDQITCTIHQIYDPTGNSLTVVLNRAEMNDFQSDFVIDLAGYSIGTADNNTFFDHLTVDFTSSGGNPGTTDISMGFDGHMNFAYFKGRVLRKTMDVPDDQVDLTVDYPSNLFDVIEPSDVQLKIEVKNEFGFPLALLGNVTATNSTTGETRTIDLIDEESDHPYLIFPANTSDNPVEIGFHSDVNELLLISPDVIEIHDAYFIVVDTNWDGSNEDYVFGEVWNTDVASGTVHGLAPFTFTLNHGTITPQFVHEIDISEDNRERITDNAETVNLRLLVDNHYPASAMISLFFSTSPDTTILYTPTPGQYPQHDFLRLPEKHLNEGADNDIEYELDADEIDFFTNETVYFGMKITFDGESEELTVVPGDYIRILGVVEINALIDTEDE